MGSVKQWMMENEENKNLEDFLNELKAMDELEGVILGITKQIEDKGVGSLTGKQRPAIESFVRNYTKGVECDICVDGNISVLTDYIYIQENGICPACNYDREKYMAE